MCQKLKPLLAHSFDTGQMVLAQRGITGQHLSFLNQ